MAGLGELRRHHGGVVPELRGKGTGRVLLAELVAAARARGDRRVLLEVFESNTAARALYEHAGFRTTTRLVGYDATRPKARAADLREVDPAEFARQMARDDPGHLPGLEPASLAAPPATARCFALEDKAFAYLSAVSETTLAVRGVLTLTQHRRQGWATRLLAGLAARFPDRAMAVPQLVPERLGADFFAARGFSRNPLTQLGWNWRWRGECPWV